LKKDLATLGYWMSNDQATRNKLSDLRKIYDDAQNARSRMNSRFIACKNLLTNRTQNIILRKLGDSRLCKRIDSIERIVEQLKNNNNELVSTFTNLALSSYYFNPKRSDIRKFIKAAK
jgi:hypothetical protein